MNGSELGLSEILAADSGFDQLHRNGSVEKLNNLVGPGDVVLTPIQANGLSSIAIEAQPYEALEQPKEPVYASDLKHPKRMESPDPAKSPVSGPTELKRRLPNGQIEEIKASVREDLSQGSQGHECAILYSKHNSVNQNIVSHDEDGPPQLQKQIQHVGCKFCKGRDASLIEPCKCTVGHRECIKTHVVGKGLVRCDRCNQVYAVGAKETLEFKRNKKVAEDFIKEIGYWVLWIGVLAGTLSCVIQEPAYKKPMKYELKLTIVILMSIVILLSLILFILRLKDIHCKKTLIDIEIYDKYKEVIRHEANPASILKHFYQLNSIPEQEVYPSERFNSLPKRLEKQPSSVHNVFKHILSSESSNDGQNIVAPPAPRPPSQRQDNFLQDIQMHRVEKQKSIEQNILSREFMKDVPQAIQEEEENGEIDGLSERSSRLHNSVPCTKGAHTVHNIPWLRTPAKANH